jgi:hypothetical protein
MSKPLSYSMIHYTVVTCLFLTLVGCSSVQPNKSGPLADFKIDIKGNHAIQISGEYVLDGKTKPISGSLPIELSMNGNSIEFNLRRVKGDGPIGVDVYIYGNKSCTCSNSREKAYIEGGGDASSFWIKSK